MRLICGIFQLDRSSAAAEIIGAVLAQMNVPGSPRLFAFGAMDP
jgi:hypothetical protein